MVGATIVTCVSAMNLCLNSINTENEKKVEVFLIPL